MVHVTIRISGPIVAFSDALTRLVAIVGITGLPQHQVCCALASTLVAHRCVTSDRSPTNMPWLGVLIGAIQIAFAFACVNQAKRKGRLNNWWVLAAALTGVIAYIAISLLPPKNRKALPEDSR